MKQMFIVLSILLFLSSCSIPSLVRFVPTELEPNHSVILKDGNSIVTSTGDSTDISVLAADSYGSLTLTVFCLNKKGNPKNIIPAQIRLIGIDEKNVVTECKVYSADEYLKYLQKLEQQLRLITAIGTSAEVASAKLETTNQKTDVEISKPGSYKKETITIETKTTGNKVAEQLAITKGTIEQEKLHQEMTELYNQSKKELLKDNTLKVGESIVGKVETHGKYGKYTFLKLTIPFANENHTFVFKPAVVK